MLKRSRENASDVMKRTVGRLENTHAATVRIGSHRIAGIFQMINSVEADKVLSDINPLSEDELNEVAGGGGWDFSFLSDPAFRQYAAGVQVAHWLATHLRFR